MSTFYLQKEQIDFLKENYPQTPIVQKVLSCENSGTFTIDTDTKIDFMDFVEDESISWMDENYDATNETVMLESIRDDIYYQTENISSIPHPNYKELL
jgi:hypothetical protein